MRTTFVFFSFILLFGCMGEAEERNNEKIVGKWKCEKFEIRNEFFEVYGVGIVHFNKSQRSEVLATYNYDFGEGDKIEIELKLWGKWGFDKNGFWDMISNVEVKKIENNTLLGDAEVSNLLSNLVTLEQKVYSKIEFVSDNKFLWKKKGEPEDVVCVKAASKQ